MSIECEYYVNCNGCGESFEEDGRIVKADSDTDVRDQAAETDWLVYEGYDGESDYCPECKPEAKELNNVL